MKRLIKIWLYTPRFRDLLAFWLRLPSAPPGELNKKALTKEKI
jgi:hypothetical protein